jgi:hypothetical protein
VIKRFLFRLAFAAMALLAAAAGFVLALIFLFVAAYNALLLVLPPWGAALVLAGVAALVGLILIAVARRMSRFSRPRHRGKYSETESLLSSLLGDNARGLAENNALATALVAVIAGVASGMSPRLREIILKFLSV